MWPNLGPTWEVFLEEAKLCSFLEEGRRCAHLSQSQSLNDGRSPIVSDLASSPAAHMRTQ